VGRAFALRLSRAATVCVFFSASSLLPIQALLAQPIRDAAQLPNIVQDFSAAGTTPQGAPSLLPLPPALINGASVNGASVNSPGANQVPNALQTDGGPATTNPATESGTPSNSFENKLSLADVIASLYRAYPLIEQARLERARTQGLITEAYGFYDTKLQGQSLAEPTGYYRNYRQGIGIARQTWWGGYLSAGYRLGRGDLQPWYKERETNKGGEFKVAMAIPLLQGRAIDAQRVAVFQASLANLAAEPNIQQAILSHSRDAAAVYWDWLAAGSILIAQNELLTIASLRGEQYEVGVKAGKFAEIDLIFNQQLIAERRVKVFETEQKFRATSYKLSLYLRDEAGQPMTPDDLWLPQVFPSIEPLPPGNFQEDLQAALNRRPEPRMLQLEIRQIEYDQQLARNNLLPTLDVLAEASQDTGTPVSSSNDKGEFELLVGVQGEVPIQRRKARGKIQSTSAKIAQTIQKLRMQQDKIGAELQTAYNALMLFAQAVDQSEAALRAAVDTLDRYRFAFDRGKVDLIYLTLLETKVTETEIKLVEAQRNWFTALAEMQAALGLDPLDQAIAVAQLPPSKRPGPGALPSAAELTPELLNQDWEKHSPATP
jgi:outer membrane protein TolC